MNKGPDMTRDVMELVERLQDEDIQDKLKPGFQQSFSASIIRKYTHGINLSPREEEVLRGLLEQLDPARKPSKFQARRYEGWQRS